ncbi:MAG TPA: hypothetical protein VIZ61_02845 [Solirubrobacterales bacterium]
MKSASRTLVKSPPELWELLDQPERMQGLMCGLLGRATEVTVDEREPESLLRWEASADGADAWIEVRLAEKGWGTNVKLKAENGDEPTRLEGWLDAVLEELGTPQKRPFAGMGDPPSEPPQPPAERPDPEPPVAETPEPESPEPGTPEPETSEPAVSKPEKPGPVAPQQGKLRRFFRL